MRSGRLAVLFALASATVHPMTANGQQVREERDELSLIDRGCCLDAVADEAVVREVSIKGNRRLDGSTIRDALHTTETGNFPWAEKRLLDKEEFRRDLQRVYVLYQRYGFFDLDLESYEVRPVGDDGVYIELRLVEGKPTIIDSLTVELLDEVEWLPEPAEIADQLPLRQGSVFNEEDLLRSRDSLRAVFENRGHAFAEVLLEYHIRKDDHSASVTYSVDPGRVYYYGNVDVVVQQEGDEALVRRQLVFGPGDVFDRRRVLDSQRRIYQLALFRRVDIQPQMETMRGDTVDVRVTVFPAPTHLVRMGVGYGTEDLVRVRAAWLDRNFFGGNRQLEVSGLYSRIEREGALTYRQPFFFVPDLTFQSSAFLRFEIEDNYTVERLGTTVRWTYRMSRAAETRVGLTVERDNFSDFDEGVLIPNLGRDFVNPSQLVWTDVRATVQKTDSLFQPTSGFVANVGYQLAMPILSSDYAYHRLTLELVHYRQLHEGWVVALKVLPGVILTYTDDPEDGGEGRVPLFQRLFSGGAASVRGYQRRQLGPKDDPASFGQDRDPEPVGGSGLFETSIELRFPLAGKFRGAAFVDAGNVWEHADDIDPSDIEYTPGAGLRYATPVGPVRFDVARRMSDRESFLPRWVFHISIGHAF